MTCQVQVRHQQQQNPRRTGTSHCWSDAHPLYSTMVAHLHAQDHSMCDCIILVGELSGLTVSQRISESFASGVKVAIQGACRNQLSRLLIGTSNLEAICDGHVPEPPKPRGGHCNADKQCRRYASLHVNNPNILVSSSIAETARSPKWQLSR